jgi:hypothetical protein
MTDVAPHLTAGFWRTRRSAAIAGIIFGLLLLAAMIMLRIALSEGCLQALQADTQPRSLIPRRAARAWLSSRCGVGPRPLSGS